MFLECASCGKMYRVREGTVAAPTKCPACGGALRTAGSTPSPVAPAAAAAAPGPDPRIKELEGKVSALERDLAAARSDAEGEQSGAEKLESELAQAREEARKKGAELESRDKRITELQGDVEKARNQATQKAQASQLSVLKQKDERIEELETRIAELEESAAAGGEKASGESQEKIAQLEKDLQEARENIPRVAEELANEKVTYHKALVGKEKEIDELNARMQKLEHDVVEAGAAAQSGGGGGESASDVFRKQLEDKEAALQKAQKTISGLERLVQDGERLYLQLRKDMEKLQEGASKAAAADGEPSPALAEKSQQIATLEEDVSRQKMIIEDLQKRLQDQEESNRREIRKIETKVRTKSGGMDEARHLAVDLDRSLGSVSSQLAALVERVKRLHQSLYKTGDESLPEGAMPGQSEKAPEEAAPQEESEPAPVETPGDPASPAEPMEAPPVEDSGASLLADAASEESGELPEAETPVEPEVQGDEVPTVEEAVAREQAKVQAEQGEEELEMLPDSPGEGLPQDETLLDMGKMGKSLRAENQPAPAPKRPETKIRPRPPAAPAAEEKKGGFFGKLFGKKK